MIKNLLFDLGGVIMELKRSACEEAFVELGLDDTGKFFGEYSQQGPFMEIEEGKITPEQFHDCVRGIIGNSDLTDREIDSAFMKFLVGIPVERLRQLQSLRRHYGIYLLSNTNPIMWNDKIASEFRKDGLCAQEYFDGIVTSFEAKALKPGAAIFKYAEDHLGIKPEETLFLDDSLDNVKAAQALGFHGLHIKPGVEFCDELAKMGIK
ncbi:MAG: HAD family phosphatase [Clostridium sp.]|nr:HAD family phosphatase [Clostridium sp.]